MKEKERKNMEDEKPGVEPETRIITGDVTDEELRKVEEAHRAGYVTYTVEDLRMNRARALASFKRIERE